MKNKIPKSLIAILVVFLVLFIDQLTKIWVKTHMGLYDSINITPWFKIYFVENNGMAFGIEAVGKLFLSAFRIIAVIAIIIYLNKLIKQDYKTGFIVCISLILAGASGNIIDSVFYGAIFEASYPSLLLHLSLLEKGMRLCCTVVVDMLYFPIIETSIPDWIPLIGGKDVLFSFYF